MPNIIVNSHGGLVTSTPVRPAPFRVPAGKTVHFYIRDGGILPNQLAWRILNNLQEGIPINLPPGVILERFTAGMLCQNYYALPYATLDVNNGIFREEIGRRNQIIYKRILAGLDSQRWGAPIMNTVITERVLLPAVQGGNPYLRDVVTLSNIVNCPEATDVHWLACREHWLP